MRGLQGLESRNLDFLLDPSAIMRQFNINDDELELLQEFGEQYASLLNSFIDDLYDWFKTLPEYSHYFPDLASLQRVQGLQLQYWKSLLKGQVTPDYLQARLRIGMVHAKIDLPIYTYLNAMRFSQEWWHQQIQELIEAGKWSKGLSLLNIFNKMLQLDTSIVTETYHQLTQKKLHETLKESQKIVKDVTSVAESVVAGNCSIKLEGESNLSSAINKMINALNQSAQENEIDVWIKTGQAQLSDLLHGDLNLIELCQGP